MAKMRKMRRMLLLSVLLLLPLLTGNSAIGMEYDTDRPGQDYDSFDLGAPNPSLCRSACARQARCRAWTYVKPGVQGPRPRCWLKHSVPPRRSAGCCVSGVKPAPPTSTPGMEYNTDRPGQDYNSFDLSSPNPGLCRSACARQARCRAWTYVKPGVQGPRPRCWLKHSVPTR
ncbi:MAG: apple domain-containing protein, partial [Desulfobacterales bacterium]|nr:apple domain-containing protein [Desulfobacterales bacterium]